jgi:hypothetical protein
VVAVVRVEVVVFHQAQITVVVLELLDKEILDLLVVLLTV